MSAIAQSANLTMSSPSCRGGLRTTAKSTSSASTRSARVSLNPWITRMSIIG
ncbi:MAG: hypothetical protein M5U08_25740 [Burkholderiales bacterium]|nr:hypothetical protein [Burkholderiales bacterium]